MDGQHQLGQADQRSGRLLEYLTARHKLLNVFVFLSANAVSVFCSESVPKWVHEVIRPIAAELEFFMPQPFAGEILGLCKALGISLGDGVLLNFAYESTA